MVEEDFQAWQIYPEHRWVFNKLELALRLGYDAGPACVPITRSGKYVVRPIYNLYGMGIGAKVIHINIMQSKSMENHALIPPGYFWCEFFDGDQYSVDYKRTRQPKGSRWAWEEVDTARGERDIDNLTRFKLWEKCENRRIFLPNFLNNIDGVPDLNVEWIGDKVVEVHLRTGNDVFWGKDEGAKVIPIWEGDNIEPDILNIAQNKIDASGYLKDVRTGYKLVD
tara:strand:- start:521 stop:1192 length:672 start_codon:yes stop_codon:yes gene_type:complete